MNKQPRENIVGATVEAVEKVKAVAKDTTSKVTTCAKECAGKVQFKAKGLSGTVKTMSGNVANKGRGFAYKALTGLCESKWLKVTEGAIVGALNRVVGDRSGPVKEDSTAAREETII